MQIPRFATIAQVLRGTSTSTIVTPSGLRQMMDAMIPVGGTISVQDDVTGASAPDNSGSIKWVKLTSGETGAGQYNEGLLTSESVSGSSPTITATAVIDHAASPMNGQTVRLINTEERFLRAGNAGVTQDSQFESHDHNYTGSNFTDGGGGTGNAASGATTRSTANTGGSETRPRNVGITYYMRIA